METGLKYETKDGDGNDEWELEGMQMQMVRMMMEEYMIWKDIFGRDTNDGDRHR